MRLTKATDNGFNLWVVEHKAPGGGIIRNMVQVSSQDFQQGGQEVRDAVALKLLEARTRCRALAMMLPPIQ